jgi:hypothetical protein
MFSQCKVLKESLKDNLWDTHWVKSLASSLSLSLWLRHEMSQLTELPVPTSLSCAGAVLTSFKILMGGQFGWTVWSHNGLHQGFWPGSLPWVIESSVLWCLCLNCNCCWSACQSTVWGAPKSHWGALEGSTRTTCKITPKHQHYVE